MGRRLNFRIRSLLLVTTILAVGVVLATYWLTPTPRPYHDIQHFVLSGWEVDVYPDLPGPFGSNGATAVLGEGQSAIVSAAAGGVTKKHHVTGIPNYQFRARPLETLDGQPTFIILKKRIR